MIEKIIKFIEELDENGAKTFAFSLMLTMPPDVAEQMMQISQFMTHIDMADLKKELDKTESENDFNNIMDKFVNEAVFKYENR
jgi:hypothetical protein